MALCLESGPALAQWIPAGVIANSNGRNTGGFSIAPDGAGGAIVAWLGDEGRTGDSYDIYAQRITADGLIAPGWPSEGLAICVAPMEQGPALVAPDGLGGAYFAWTDYRDYFVSGSDIYVQHVTSNGERSPGWSVNGTPVAIVLGDQVIPEIAQDGAGGVFVVWADHRRDPGYPFGAGTQTDYYAQHVTAAGTVAPGWPSDGLPICTVEGQRNRIRVIPDEGTGFIAVWTDYRQQDPGGGTFVVRIAAEGHLSPGWNEGGTRASGTGLGALPATDGKGGLFVSGYDYRQGGSGDAFAQHMTGLGEVATGWPADGILLTTAYEEQTPFSIVADGTGGAIVIWIDYRNYFPNGADVYAQRVLGDGTIAPGWPTDGAPVVATSLDFEVPGFLAAVSDGAGGALVPVEGINQGVLAQHITGAGTLAPGWPASGARVTTLYGLDAAATSDGAGGMLVAFRTDAYIRVQRVSGDCPPTAPSASVELSIEPAVLNASSQGKWLTARLEPRSPRTASEIDVASLRLNGNVSVDPAVQPQMTDADGDGVQELTVKFPRGAVILTLPSGQDSVPLRVTGRIADQCLFGVARVRVLENPSKAATGDPELSSGPAAATEPPPSDELTVSPHPVRDSFRLRFYARGAEPASLALYDVGGRRVASHSLSSRNVGWQTTQIDARALGTGMYFLRLDDARGARTRRVLVAR